MPKLAIGSGACSEDDSEHAVLGDLMQSVFGVYV
jgi:hypothetical protein